MINFSTDADLWKWEPRLFCEIRNHGQLGLEHQRLTRGSGASNAGGQVVAPSAQFVSAHIRPGHVIHLTAEQANVPRYFMGGYYAEVEVVRSETELQVWPPLPSLTDLDFEIHTFDPQHEEARWALLARFGLEAENIERQLQEHPHLRQASTALVLATVYRSHAIGGLAAKGTAMPALRKAKHYARVYENEVAKVR